MVSASRSCGRRMQEPLQQLQRKLEFAEQSEAARESAALRDVAPELERLRARSAFKCREFLVQKCAAALCACAPPLLASWACFA